ncbi:MULTISPECIES: 50S ribosomal protein L9 [unclassified Campylobacter]|uniref:50S ribosomal protein L9 n=1 Tax=unclassified Campylobacter TaxID=2593542 RepID=UPI0012382508|nr:MULTISPECIES: 50S ribosomal protein L9 [unclassified Campylobacter]KAA6220575.1 50S ribosomal protein L9 [Campylobacter sp. LR185c]KAA6226297.1 50S ribosomal protein L9 [Campylobacter sp. LR286c]KAA6226789.1 50S ribosomal protein L9 [Campylobacter sp. LR196d]KAA6230226.1 50S ribosomal protein L9 [Campylobacter sp. LR291e]KAA6233747.1 50S ribosomal protein L9 [Campylobacter sp. LR264d]
MKVLLIKDVKALGKAGEVKEVKDGYGQNFLIAKGFAKLATNEVLKKFESDKKKEAENLRFELANLEKLKEELEKITIEIFKPVGANGSLFGGVTKDEIIHALKEQKKLELDKKSLECDTLKSIGLHEVSVKLGHAIHAKFKVDLKAE